MKSEVWAVIDSRKRNRLTLGAGPSTTRWQVKAETMENDTVHGKTSKCLDEEMTSKQESSELQMTV
jgi:hypothetical protein